MTTTTELPTNHTIVCSRSSAWLRDSEIVASIFDERNPAVKKMIADVIVVSLSDYSDFAQSLVGQRIDNISWNPDTVLRMTLAILE